MSEPSRLRTVIIWCAAGVCAAALAVLLRRFYHDDAYIALRYAKNLLAGRGLVWNEGERVEGYTSLLWVIACSALGGAGVDLETASRLLGLASFGALLFVLRKEQDPGAFTCLLLSTMGPVVAWSIGGLETVMFAFLLTAGLLAGERLLTALRSRSEEAKRAPGAPASLAGRAFLTGAVLAAAELCRPEATLFFLLLAGFVLFDALKLAPGARAALGALCAGFATLAAPRLVWRIATYHDLLPNTFYVKAGSGLADAGYGLVYLGRFLAFFPGVVLLAVVAAFSLPARPISHDRRFLLASILLYISYVVWIGGDHMQWFRFIVPVLPIVFLLPLRRLDKAPRIAVVLALVGGLNLVSTVTLAARKGWIWRDAAARSGTAAGLYIRDHWPKEALVALNTAGSTAYFSEARCIDMLGLNDRHIARRKMPPPPGDLPWSRLPGHRKGDGAYVLSRKPDFIILGGSEGYFQPWFAGDREIFVSDEFHRNYAPREALLSGAAESPAFRFRFYERCAPGPCAGVDGVP